VLEPAEEQSTEKKVKIEMIHALIMFLGTLPFYLYGGDVLYGHALLSNMDAVTAFVVRVLAAVLITEFSLNWLPTYVLHKKHWREGWLYMLIGGFVFGMFSYMVIPSSHHEGEAVIGMGAVWIVGSIIVGRLYRVLGWY